MEKDIALKFIDFKGAHNGLRRFYGLNKNDWIKKFFATTKHKANPPSSL